MSRVPAAQVSGAAAGANPVRTLRFLADLSQALAVSFELAQTLPDAVDRIARFMDVEGAALFLIDRAVIDPMPGDHAAEMLECRISTALL